MGVVRSLRGSGGIGDTFRGIKRRIASLGVLAATRAAARSAPAISAAARNSYTSGRTAYGDARPPGKYGPLTLIDTGATLRFMSFTADGTTIRAKLGTPYARYLIGKYRILPVGDRNMIPIRWARIIEQILQEEISSQWQVAA